MLELPEFTDYEGTRAEFSLEIPEFYNFAFDVIEKRAAEADKTAFIYVARDGATIEHHSFSDLNKAADRFANVLLGLGAVAGDFAFVMIPRLPAWYQVMIGCIKTGVVAMPGTNLLMPKDIEYRINKSKAKLAIVTAEAAGKIEDIRANCPSLEHLIVIGGTRDGWTAYEAACAAASDELGRDDVPRTRADDTMLVYFTSGTTAFPKMVPRDHGYALAHAITGRYWMDLREDDIHWTLSDTGWAKAAWGMLFPPWLMGTTIVLYDGDLRFDADAHLRLVERLGVTTFCAPPTVYRVFAQADLADYDLGSIRHSISAGEPLNPEVMRVWKDVTGTDVYDGYGQTETINIVANIPGLEVRPGSMGRPVPGLDVDVIDDHGNVVADDEVGHIGVRVGEPSPPGLFTGYFGDDAATAACFHDGWYFTGDTATRDADGYIWFVGRSDDIISSAGYRISPFEVESALQEHPAVAESAVVAKPDELRGSIVKAFVIAAPGYEPSPELVKDIQDFVKSQTAPYKYPREIEFREALPKTVSGKIRRVELRAEAEGEGEV
ncbi:MAG: acyl--CoA ligase [Alphaproteobacteria bacterium]|nr:acyl--CoA ligase [Alphaproteobacteria bacterium]